MKTTQICACSFIRKVYHILPASATGSAGSNANRKKMGVWEKNSNIPDKMALL